MEAARSVQKTMDNDSYALSEKEKAGRAFRRSFFVAKDTKVSETFTCVNVCSIRLGHGMPVKELDMILGRKAARNLERATPLAEHDIA